MIAQAHLSSEDVAQVRSNLTALGRLSERYRNDASLRTRLDSGDVSDTLSDLGITLPSGIQARFVADTPEVFHFIMPPDPNSDLADEALAAVAGGATANAQAGLPVPCAGCYGGGCAPCYGGCSSDPSQLPD